MSGDVTVISGPTAVGKGTVVTELRRRHPEVWVSVSATTRSPRPSEAEGEHYLFIDDAAFDELIATDELLEWATVHGSARYGTPAAPVRAAVAAGKRVILEIDLQGARQVLQRLDGVRSVFIAPPNRDALKQRLVGRGTETPDQMERRLATAELELAAAGEFQHVIVNDDLGSTVNQLVDLLGL